MTDHPLARPASRELWRGYAARFGLVEARDPRINLAALAQSFGRLPYENLTKIIKWSEVGTPEKARRPPAEVLADHGAWGAGGTCFSLTATLLHLIRSLGWQAEPILADRRYGADTHCALVVWVDGQPCLLDPGFLIDQPLPVPRFEPVTVETRFNRLVLIPRDSGERVDLFTEQNGQRTYRLTFKTSPADEGAYLRAWDESFSWEMMAYPVLTRVDTEGQWYMRGRRLQHRDRHQVERADLARDGFVERVAATFGLHPPLVARAVKILQGREGDGERDPAG